MADRSSVAAVILLGVVCGVAAYRLGLHLLLLEAVGELLS